MKRDLAGLGSRPHDLLVLGGGIYGLAAAWDAAQRGLAVALVEADDFGSGASWNSLKTIHGGLRHLQRADVASHRESVRERRALMRIAPELVRPLPFLVPTYGHGARGRELFGIGLALNDVLGFDRNRGLPRDRHLPAGRMLSPREVERLVPGLSRAGLTGAALWPEAQLESGERLIMGFARAAAEAGAHLANRAEVVGLIREADRIAGARVRDRLHGGELEVRARVVLNATGPAADRILAGSGIARPPQPLLMAQNLVLEGPWPLAERIAVGAASGGRFLFLVPWRDRLLVGTEYFPADQPRGPEAVAAFLDEAAQAFPWAGLGERTLKLVHRGLVPGRGGPRGLALRPRFHDHALEDGLPGLITLQGVKYTTARGVAERAVDAVFRHLGRSVPACRTADTPLPWAHPLPGSLAERAQAAVREEMAHGLVDVALRRLDIGTGGPPPAAELEVVVRALAEELGWDERRVGQERAALADAQRVA